MILVFFLLKPMNSKFDILFVSFVYDIVLDTWEEAREYLPAASNGTLEAVLKKQYGRGKRHKIPNPIFSPNKNVEAPLKKKRIVSQAVHLQFSKFWTQIGDQASP